jgi:hypothetical protein
VRNLPASGKPGFARQLPEDQYWGLLVPVWQTNMQATSETTACNGAHLFQDKQYDGLQLDPAGIR